MYLNRTHGKTDLTNDSPPSAKCIFIQFLPLRMKWVGIQSRGRVKMIISLAKGQIDINQIVIFGRYELCTCGVTKGGEMGRSNPTPPPDKKKNSEVLTKPSRIP
jgi:hypothetical protein